ncbi:MAG: substrate-binding domain-containing protein, partial [Acidobacteriaceae bacterium]|nr:substrate-binding domain-containing protein [Acidobacteriaceae bacterium]
MSTSYQEIAFFFDALRQGIREAALPFASTVDLQFRTVRRLGEGEAERFREALEEKANGLIVAPGHPAEVRMWIRKAARQHVPVVCVATDAPKTERLTAVAADAYTAGAMVAECLLRAVQVTSSVLIVTGDLSTVDHAEKVRGFREFLSHGAHHLSVGPIVEAHDDPEEAYTQVRECLRRDGQIRAVYVSTAHSLPVLRALDEVAGQRSLSVITTDLSPELIRYLREGRIMAT